MDEAQAWLDMSPEQRIIYTACEGLAKALDLPDAQASLVINAISQWVAIRVVSRLASMVDARDVEAQRRARSNVQVLVDEINGYLAMLRTNNPHVYAFSWYCLTQSGLCPESSVVLGELHDEPKQIDIVPEHLRKKAK